MGIITIKIITTKIGVIIGIIKIIKITIGIVVHDIEIITLIVLLPQEIYNPILIIIILIMVAIGIIQIILVDLCPKILHPKIKNGLKCLMVIQTRVCQSIPAKFQVG
jgi:hypothetical protein